MEKYGSIGLEEDDEFDLLSGRIVRDSGRLRAMKGRAFGEFSDDDEGEDGEEDEVEEELERLRIRSLKGKGKADKPDESDFDNWSDGEDENYF